MDHQLLNHQPRFIVDSNVGRLGKWLRLLGYDTLFIHPIEDGALVDIALSEQRILLTKDTHVLRRRLVTSGQVTALLIEGDGVMEQLRQVAEAFGLDPSSRRFSRCNECNEPLVAKAREDVRDLVPRYVYETQSRFTFCPRCGRVFWSGTHWARMTERLNDLLREG